MPSCSQGLHCRTRSTRASVWICRGRLYIFVRALCVLIVLPLSWLLLRLDDAGGFTLGNFRQLISDPAFVDPLITTFILATSASVICCAVAAPIGWLVARTDMPARSDSCAGHGFVRDATLPRRDRLGVARSSQ